MVASSICATLNVAEMFSRTDSISSICLRRSCVWVKSAYSGLGRILHQCACLRKDCGGECLINISADIADVPGL